MKKILFVLALFIFCQQSQAQKSANQVSIGPEVNIPVGVFSNYYKTGFGGSVKGLYGVGKSGQVTLTVGYSAFSGKGTVGGYDFSSQKFYILPILAGYRQHFSSLYVEPQLGVARYTTKSSGDYKFTETRFTWAVGAGYAMNAFDLGVRYQNHTGSGLLAIRAAYTINFKK